MAGPTYGDYAIEDIMPLIQSGQLTLPHPETGEPIVGFSQDGKPLTASSLGAIGAAGSSGGIGMPQSQAINPDEVINRLQADQDSARWEANTGTGRYADPNEQRFGSDLSWLDPMFQQDTTNSSLNEARAQGTSADPAMAARQSGLIDQILSRGTSADPSTEAAQRKAMDELFGIYEQGGLTAVERNERAKNRASTEDWLRGQREADMQDMAERGMAGSGSELATILGDRQAASSRLSAADLQTSADAEKRALDALLGGGDMATTMRGQGNDYQLANSMQAASIMDNSRNASDRYVQENADRISRAKQANTDFLRNAWTDMMTRRNQWDQNVFNNQVGVAQGQQGFDASQNGTGFGQGTDLAIGDAGDANRAQGNFNQSGSGAYYGSQSDITQTGQSTVAQTAAPYQASGRAFSAGDQIVASYLGGGKSGSGSQQNGKTTQSTTKGY